MGRRRRLGCSGRLGLARRQQLGWRGPGFGRYRGFPNTRLGGTTPDTGHDRIWVDVGDADLGGTLDVRLINGYLPNLNDTFDIVQADNVIVPLAGPGVLFDFSNLPTGLEFDAAIVALPDNRQALRLQVNAVPEAGSLAVLAIDTLLIARRRVA